MRAVVFPAIGQVEVREVPDPVARPGELVLSVGAAGICGTDLHILAGEFPLARLPVIPGHEFSGTVVEVGTDVDGFAPGDRVGVDPGIFCGTCGPCRKGRGNLCRRFRGYGSSLPGAFAERVAVLASHAYHLPDRVSLPEAALLEPIACAVHAMHRLAPALGESVLVYGAGTMGLILAQLARFGGARPVALWDRKVSKLERARTFGFDVLAHSSDEIRTLAPEGFDNVIDATGVTSVVESAFQAVAVGGKLLVFGVCPPGERAGFDAFRIYSAEIDIVGSLAVFGSFGAAVQLLAAGAVDAQHMVTHTFALEEFPHAIDVVRSGEGIKVQVAPQG